MEFQPSEERRMLSDTLSRYLAEHYDFAHRTAVAYADPWHDPAAWDGLVELGLIHALVPEERGGFGGTGFDVTCVFEALGRALCPEPVLGALLDARLLPDDDLEPLLGGIRHALAIDEPGRRPGDAYGTVAENNRLTGRKTAVYGGASAQVLVLAAGDPVGLFAVDSAAAEVTPWGMIDGGNAADVQFDNITARPIAENCANRISDALDWGRLALAAEALGAMDVAFDMTLDYVKTRKQFGRAIGSFQALQHRLVDLKTEIEQVRSITILAASRMGGADQSRSVSMAKSLAGRTAQQVAEEAIQIHGGIGMTWEHPVSHYAKRLVMIDAQLGDSDHHLSRVMASLQATG